MSTPFDMKKAIREQLAGLVDTKRVFQDQVAEAELAVARAENQLKSARLMLGTVDIFIDDLRAKLVRIEEMERRT